MNIQNQDFVEKGKNRIFSIQRIQTTSVVIVRLTPTCMTIQYCSDDHVNDREYWVDVQELTNNKDEELVATRARLRGFNANKGKRKSTGNGNKVTIRPFNYLSNRGEGGKEGEQGEREYGSEESGINVEESEGNEGINSNDEVTYMTISDSGDSKTEHARKRVLSSSNYDPNNPESIFKLSMVFDNITQLRQAIVQ